MFVFFHIFGNVEHLHLLQNPPNMYKEHIHHQTSSKAQSEILKLKNVLRGIVKLFTGKGIISIRRLFEIGNAYSDIIISERS